MAASCARLCTVADDNSPVPQRRFKLSFSGVCAGRSGDADWAFASRKRRRRPPRRGRSGDDGSATGPTSSSDEAASRCLRLPRFGAAAHKRKPVKEDIITRHANKYTFSRWELLVYLACWMDPWLPPCMPVPSSHPTYATRRALFIKICGGDTMSTSEN